MKKLIFSFFKLFKNQKILFLVLTCIVGIFILIPTHNFQAPLAQGDHGRDLYAFRQTLNGATPYQDYWWVYGPLMPYYYGLIFKLFGFGVQNILLGEAFLKICAVLFCYLAFVQFFSPVFSFSTAIWFCAFQPPFSHTYNHTGGIAILVLLVYILFSYIRIPKFSLQLLAFFVTIILSLIKINFGLASLVVITIIFPLIDVFKKSTAIKKYFYFLEFLISLLIILIIYWLFIKNLPIYAIRQCLPLLGSDHPYNTSLFSSLSFLIKNIWITITGSWIHAGIFGIFLSSIIKILLHKPKTQEEKLFKKNVLLAAGTILLLTIFMLHEFLPSGVSYRLFWAKPFQIFFIFIIIGHGMHTFNKKIRWLFCFMLLAILTISSYQQHKIINYFKNPYQQLKINKTNIYLTNSPSWFLTVYRTTKYLNDHLTKDETFFALPYDALYYFLTDKKSPTRQLIFFDHINIPHEQELKIISELEKNNTNYIVLSSRCDAKEHGLGTFGKTYCPLIAAYIIKNFEVVQTIGDWSNEPGWAWNHGTKIFKRIRK